MRIVAVLLAILASGWGGSARLGAEEKQATAPPHDLAQLVRSSPQAGRLVPERRDVVLLKAYDGDPALQHGAEQGLLLREVVRQALLLAAREELGLPTRDATLREGFPEPGVSESSAPGAPWGSLQIVSSIPGRHPSASVLRVSVFLEKSRSVEMLWEKEIALHENWWHTIEGIANKIEPLTRTELVAVLRRAGYAGSPNRWVEKGPVPDDVLRRSAEWSMISQFFALRTLHRLIRDEGESPERLAALAEAYARLGTLTAWHWSPAHQVFKARALLYAQRLVTRTQGASLSRQTRAYVLALLGRHGYALNVELARLKAQREAEGAELSGKMQAIDAFCRFDAEQLDALAADPELRPLVRFLQFLAVEPLSNEEMVKPAALALLKEQPYCFPAIDAIARQGELSDRLGGGEQLVASLLPSLQEGLGRQADLPAAARKWVEQTSTLWDGAAALDAAQLRRRQTLVAALREAGTIENDRAEPSWDCFAQLLLEQGFAAAARRIRNQRSALGIPAEEMHEPIQELSPLLEGHPYEEGIRSFGRSAEENRQRIPEFLAALDPGEFERTNLPMARYLNDYHPPAFAELAGPSRDHLDLVYSDLVMQIEADASWDGKGAAWKLTRISPHAPMRFVGQLRHQWHKAEVVKRTHEFEQRYGDHPEVLRELGRRYREMENWDAAERVTNRLVTIEPSQRSYEALAAVFAAQEQWDQWLETMQAFLETPETGLAHARFRSQIANHYMDRGEFEVAFPYAEAAAQSWSAWGMLTAIRCYDGLGNPQETEKWLRRLAERYDGYTALEWYFWCRRTGVGDVQAAQERALRYIESLGRPLQDSELLRIGTYRILAGQAEQALWAFQEWYARDKHAYPGFHAALTARELGQTELCDNLLQQIIDRSDALPEGEPRGPHGRLARLLQSSVKEGGPPQLDPQAVDDLVRTVPPGDPTNLYYFAGRFLWLYGQTGEASRYLRLAAESPLPKFNRYLAGALLRDHGITYGGLRREELPSQQD